MQLIELHSKSRGLVRCAIAFQNDQIFPNNKTNIRSMKIQSNESFSLYEDTNRLLAEISHGNEFSMTNRQT